MFAIKSKFITYFKTKKADELFGCRIILLKAANAYIKDITYMKWNLIKIK